LSKEQQVSLKDDFDRFKLEALKDKPSRKWYSLSAEGLIDAAKSVGEVGKPVLEIISSISSLLKFS
ncbi:MAG: hypothetical protein SFY66_26280, partial [Oculatellaceae cyanobacterium bins.114]|nr:hypothetical protein [Oculatellaceae cyanobacterium bins.114]